MEPFSKAVMDRFISLAIPNIIGPGVLLEILVNPTFLHNEFRSPQ